ncbi:MAG: hypothetical protein K1V90_08725 [Muribaculaceae bacterium]
MTLNDLKGYAKRINAKMKPTDKLAVTLNREATTYIFAYLKNRKRNLEQSLSATNISDKKRDKRQYEYNMICEAINAINKAKEL